MYVCNIKKKSHMKFDLGTQEKFTIGQFIFVNTWWRIWWRIWYKKIRVRGLRNMYTKKPMIIVANHQNAAMDALVMVGIQTRQIVWLARADIFNSKIARPILRFFGIMPIYRMHDGKETLGQNERIFKKCVEVLQAGRLLALFPEATHWGFRRLRSLKKAVPRIAFLAEEMSNNSLDIHILPVGIYYENYVGVRRNLFVNIGKPFPIREYVAMQQENQNKAQIALRNKIQEEMLEVMLHINHTDERYEAYDELRHICSPIVLKKEPYTGSVLYREHLAHKKVVAVLDAELEKNQENIEEIEKETKTYTTMRNALNFREHILAERGGDVFEIIWNCAKLIIGLPVFIIGFLSTFLQYKYSYKLAKKMAQDVQFHNSITFVLGFLLIPITYSILSLVAVLVFSLSWWMFFVIGPVLLVIAVLSFDYYRIAKKTYHMIRYHILEHTKSESFKDLVTQREKIIALFTNMYGGM